MLFDPCSNCGCPASAQWRVYLNGCTATTGSTTFVASPLVGIAGALCELYADAGRTILVAYGVTNAVGRVDVPVPPGTYYPRITPASPTRAVIDAPAITIAGVDVDRGYITRPAAGYVCPYCAPGCEVPLPSSISVSCNFGSTVMTVDGAGPGQGMSGLITYDFPGWWETPVHGDPYLLCPPGPITVGVAMSGGPDGCGLSFWVWRNTGDPVLENGTCPGGTILIAGWPAAATSMSCPPGFISYGSATRIIPNLPGSGALHGYRLETLKHLFGDNTATFWYTMTG